MKKHILTSMLGLMALSMGAQTFQEWKDPTINEVNRAPMHTNYFAYESADMAKKGVKENSANFMSLNGTWKFFWVKDADARPTSGSQASMTKVGTTCQYPDCGNFMVMVTQSM